MTQTLEARDARSRAGKIREGIRDYLTTLALIKEAWDQRDWEALGYASWQSYIDGEFSEHRLGLTAEHRKKAVEELRLAGMSQRAIGTALGVTQDTVRRDLQVNDSVHLPAGVTGTDGKTYVATRPRVETAAEDVEATSDSADGRGAAAPGPTGRTATAPAPGSGIQPEPGVTPEPDPGPAVLHQVSTLDGDARLDAELDAALADTAVRFRANFSAALARADDVWQFDVDRIVEVYATDFDRSVRPFLDEMTRWCERVATARRKQTSGLRVINGGVG